MKGDIKFPMPLRIGILAVVGVIILAGIIGTIFGTQTAQEKAPPEDTNVYLNEEVCYAKDIYIKVIGLSVYENEAEAGDEDDDGDMLSGYTLNLTLEIEQRAEKKGSNTTIKSEMFTLKSSNIKSKSTMGMFFQRLQKQRRWLCYQGQLMVVLTLLRKQ